MCLQPAETGSSVLEHWQRGPEQLRFPSASLAALPESGSSPARPFRPRVPLSNAPSVPTAVPPTRHQLIAGRALEPRHPLGSGKQSQSSVLRRPAPSDRFVPINNCDW